MKYLLKLFLVTLTVLTIPVLHANEFKKPPYDKRLNLKLNGKLWYENSDTDSDSAYNLGVYYDQVLKEYKTAEFWYKKAWSIDKNIKAVNNLGFIYHSYLNKLKEAEYWYKKRIELENNNPNGLFNLALLYDDKLNNPNLAIKYYKKAYKFKTKAKDSAYNLAYLYEDLKNHSKAIKWYEKAISEKSLKGLKNIARLYHHILKDDIKAAEYFIALIDNRYPKNKVLNFFKQKWKLSDETIKKGYEAQLKSKIIPEKLKYKGGI
ncbi:sel1 repeat family protein [Sulfurimonas lithotrophica]|uniref:beta-lactamase n=1 Tax=Sulfurimonas lithotrophica TaxID=2590022 RepID=A0A5P8NZQ4_9BACT|nr:SEL1-like repeat protein [Sulfurimonas lithotrophica]QFR48929.1 sel1 repeat family protein [Sulfurimonas lithotrophica]